MLAHLPSRLARGAGRAAVAPNAAGRLRRGAWRSVCTVNFKFLDEGEEVPVSVEAGKSVLEAAHENDVDLEGDGRACATCLPQLRPPFLPQVRVMDLLHVPRAT